MALQGQRFELDLDSENWKFDLTDSQDAQPAALAVSGIKERKPTAAPAAPTMKSSRTGFPEHRTRKPQSAFKNLQQSQRSVQSVLESRGPSDAAILHHAAKAKGVDLSAAKEKVDIDAENRRRINDMSVEELEDARAELMAQFNPSKLQEFLQRANVDDDHTRQQKEWDEHELGRPKDSLKKAVAFKEDALGSPADWSVDATATATDAQEAFLEPEDDMPYTLNPPVAARSSTHFPKPPRNRSDFKPLDPNSSSFLTDLKTHYFPDLPHDPSQLSWLTDPTEAEAAESPYNPDRAGFAPSALRFDFKGQLITPSESLEIPTSKGLHHHGDAPHSAGYAIPELTLLARSSLPSQRCVAYQIIGRILYRLGRGDFGARGQEMCESLWGCIERERILEVVMGEANREGKGTHQSAKAYATEALWLWRRGGGGDRGILKEGERRAI